jgi:hypothetical protein
MVDRVELLTAVCNRVADRGSLSAAQSQKFNGQLDRALAIVLAELTLDDARVFSPPERVEIENALRSILTEAELKNVAKKWEPKRKIDSDATKTDVTRALVELLQGQREPYLPCAYTLEQARALRGTERTSLRESISRLASDADRKNLAKKWDKDNPALTKEARSTLVASLLSLLDGKTEPMTKPKPAKGK